MGEISQIISSVGFPIAMCVLMCYYIKYTSDNHRKDLINQQEKHLEETGKLTEVISNNTLVVKELSDKFDFIISDKEKGVINNEQF